MTEQVDAMKYLGVMISSDVVSSELHSSDRIGRQGKKGQRPSSNSKPTLYRGVSATRAINLSRDPPSPIALKYRFFPCRPILSELWSSLLSTFSNQLTNTH